MKKTFLATFLMLIGLSLLAPAMLVNAADQSPIQIIREKIVKIMSENPMVPFLSDGGLEFCKAFFDDFKAQTNIEYIEPIVVADDYNSKELQPYKDQCPDLELNKNVMLEPRIADALRREKVPEEEWDRHGGRVYYGRSNFKLFKVDINNNSQDGDEYVFYEERYRGEKVADMRGGDYRVVDFKKCKVLAKVIVDQSGDLETRPAYNGIIKYKGKHYIYDLYVAGYYSLNSDGYNAKKKKMMPICSFHKAR